MEFYKKKLSKVKKISCIFTVLSIGTLSNSILKADQIANSSIDLKKDIENIKQKNFKNKKNLVSPIKQSIDEQGNIQKKKSEKTIFLKSIELSGNKLYSNEKLIKIFEGLINKDVTFTALSNAALKVQSLYRENGYITTRVILPKQDFVKGNIKVAVIESYLEDIVITGGTKGTRDYIKYMTSNVLKDNQKNQIFNFDDLERQLLLVKKSNIGKLTSTLSKGSKLGTSLLTINVDPYTFNSSAFANTDISNNLVIMLLD